MVDVKKTEKKREGRKTIQREDSDDKIGEEALINSRKKKDSKLLPTSGSSGRISSKSEPKILKDHKEHGKHMESRSICFCNLVVNGPKLSCNTCGRIFHARCLGIPSNKADKLLSFVCLYCNQSITSPTGESPEKSRRMREKELEKKRREDLLRENYKNVVHRIRRKSDNTEDNEYIVEDLDKAIQLSLQDQIEKKEKEEPNSSEIDEKIDMKPESKNIVKSPSSSKASTNPLSRKILKEKKEKR